MLPSGNATLDQLHTINQETHALSPRAQQLQPGQAYHTHQNSFRNTSRVHSSPAETVAAQNHGIRHGTQLPGHDSPTQEPPPHVAVHPGTHSRRLPLEEAAMHNTAPRPVWTHTVHTSHSEKARTGNRRLREGGGEAAGGVPVVAEVLKALAALRVRDTLPALDLLRAAQPVLQ